MLNGPKLDRGPQFADHWHRVLLLKQLDFALVKGVLFYSTTLAQDAPDITGAGFEYIFTWSYSLETGYYIVAH